MVKVVTYFKRKPGMSVDDFQQHWRTAHAELIVRLPGIRGYVQSHLLDSAYRKGEPMCDAVAESYFDDTQAIKALASTPEYGAVLADEPNFIDAPSMDLIITDEYVIKDSPVPEDALKSIDFVTRNADMSVAEFQSYWRDIHGPLCQAAQAMLRYRQSHTRRSAYDRGKAPSYDGVAMIWYQDMQALRSAAATPEFEMLRSDVENFMARDRSCSVLTREQIILPYLQR